MSYLLDIFNKRQPAPQQERVAPSFDTAVNMGEPLPFGRPMTMPSGGPNTGTPMPPAPDLVSISGPTPMDDAMAIACGLPPGSVSGGQVRPGNGGPMGGMGGGMPAFNLPPNFNVSGPQQMPNPGMGGVSQMPAFQPPQPMPFNNRPMPQFGAPNFSMQNGTIGAPQPSPMNGMMKGMFGVR